MQEPKPKQTKKSKGKTEPTMRTAFEIAEELGVHKTTINRLAKTHEIGTPWGLTKIRLFSDDEVQRIKGLCHMQKGNPNFSRKN